jgi:hypothetical protein
MSREFVPHHEDWAARLGQQFTVTFASGHTAPLVLAECSPRVVNGDVASYSLLFTGDADAASGQGIVSFSAAGFGPAEVFIVPVQPRGDGVEFEAVYNQLGD